MGRLAWRRVAWRVALEKGKRRCVLTIYPGLGRDWVEGMCPPVFLKVSHGDGASVVAVLGDGAGALLALSPLLAYVAIGGGVHEIPVKEARIKRGFSAGRLKITVWAEAERVESEPLVPLQLLPLGEPRR